MSNRIEQVIGDIEEYIDGCKMQAFSNTKIIVDRPQLEEFLDELRQYTPEEVKKYQRMLNNRDKILSDAKKKAAEVEDKAQAYADHLVSENQITRMAYDKANEILKDAQEQAKEMLDSATEESDAIRKGALDYTNAMLENLRSIVSGTVEDTQNRYTALLSSLSEHLNIIESNQRELNNQAPEQEERPSEKPFFEAEADDEEDDEYEE